MKIEKGQLVHIRGDLRKNLDGSCSYLPEQLVAGKYVKRHGTDQAWTGRVEAVSGDMAKVGGGWRHVELYEPVDE